MKTTPSEKLREAADTFERKAKEYGDNYYTVGFAMNELFPNGIELKTGSDFIRHHLLTLMMVKIGRYAMNFKNNGHSDSLHDLAVYASMLESTDEDLFYQIQNLKTCLPNESNIIDTSPATFRAAFLKLKTSKSQQKRIKSALKNAPAKASGKLKKLSKKK